MNRPALPTLVREDMTHEFLDARAVWRSSIEERRLIGATYGWDSAEYDRAIDRALTLEQDCSAARMRVDHAQGLHDFTAYFPKAAPYCPDCQSEGLVTVR